MNNKYFQNETINLLKNNTEVYTLIESSDGKAKEIVNNLEAYFPIFEWGKINWDFIENSICFVEKDDKKIVEIILKICKKYKLHSDVYIIWSNAVNPIININLDVALNYLENIILEDMDTWIISSSFEWCIEVYHEGEVCFGYNRRKVQDYSYFKQ